LAELIRPAGYYQVKTRRLRNLLKFVVEEYDGSLDAMFSTSVDALREQLLSIHGIGPETADAILLYAGGLPSFVVDTYTHRIRLVTAGSVTTPTIKKSRTSSSALCPPTPRSTMNIMRCWCASERTIASDRLPSVTSARSPICYPKEASRCRRKGTMRQGGSRCGLRSAMARRQLPSAISSASIAARRTIHGE
jgi:endonuclease III